MDFLKKPNLAVNGTSYSRKPYSKPTTCPFCGIGTDGTVVSANMYTYRNNQSCVVISIKCTGCGQNFIALYERVDDELTYITVHPTPSGKALDPCFSEISQRFVEVHKESETAELMGLTDLAAMGYRKALEIIIKDFAIKELVCNEDEVAKKSLADAISEYLNQEALVKTADVVRILGNDHTHYREKHPEFDFSLLKYYYDVFLSLVLAQYRIKHPPVERK